MLMRLVVLLSLICSAVSQHRKISATINPGCNIDKCNNITVVHISAQSDKDTLHHIWDFTTKPTVMTAISTRNSTLEIDWLNYLSDDIPNSVTISPDPTYVYSVIINKIVEFNDSSDSATFNEIDNNPDYINPLNIEEFQWKMTEFIKSDDNIKATLRGTPVESNNSSKESANKGEITIILTAFGTTEHSLFLPRLLHTSNATQIELILNKFRNKYANGRFTIQIISQSSELQNATVDFLTRKSLDDENSPGIFKVKELLTRETNHYGGGFLEWRMVAYTTSDHTMINSTNVINGNLTDVDDPITYLNDTLPYAFFGDGLEMLSMKSFYVTFGTKKDGFYGKTNYVSWTFLTGYGKPVEETMSLFITLVLILGFGACLILIILAASCIVYNKISKRSELMLLG